MKYTRTVSFTPSSLFQSPKLISSHETYSRFHAPFFKIQINFNSPIATTHSRISSNTSSKKIKSIRVSSRYPIFSLSISLKERKYLFQIFCFFLTLKQSHSTTISSRGDRSCEFLLYTKPTQLDEKSHLLCSCSDSGLQHLLFPYEVVSSRFPLSWRKFSTSKLRYSECVTWFALIVRLGCLVRFLSLFPPFLLGEEN